MGVAPGRVGVAVDAVGVVPGVRAKPDMPAWRPATELDGVEANDTCNIKRIKVNQGKQ